MLATCRLARTIRAPFSCTAIARASFINAQGGWQRQYVAQLSKARRIIVQTGNDPLSG